MRNGHSKDDCEKLNVVSEYFDSPSIIVCNNQSLISYNSLQSPFLFDVLCIKIDQVVMELTTKMLTKG